MRNQASGCWRKSRATHKSDRQGHLFDTLPFGVSAMLSHCQVFTLFSTSWFDFTKRIEATGHQFNFTVHSKDITTFYLPSCPPQSLSCSRFFPFPSFELPTLPLQGTSASSFSLPTGFPSAHNYAQFFPHHLTETALS